MKKDNLIVQKSFDFAVRIVKVYKYLIEERKEYVLSKQLLRSGTSIGANVNEAIQGQSKKDFIAKLSISLKESVETEYWIKLLVATEYLTEAQTSDLAEACVELIKMLTAIIKTTKERNNE